jgi:hypothetical protein
MGDVTTVRLRGDGGCVWEFELPLSEAFQAQVDKGQLVPDDVESAKALGANEEPPADADTPVPEPADEAPEDDPAPEPDDDDAPAPGPQGKGK